MGILHLAGLGRNPGAVTSALSYLIRRYGKNNPEWGEMVEELIILTSPEVIDGKMKARECMLNEYGSMYQFTRAWLEGSNALEIIKEFCEQEGLSGKLLICKLDVNDFSECFKRVGQIVLRYHPPGEVGKHIWANITGGTNPLNAAILQVGFLSGFIVKVYYTFLSSPEYMKFLRPFVKNDPNKFDFREYFIIKTVFDERFVRVLEKLETTGRLGSEELLSRLKGERPEDFSELEQKSFVRDYVNVMDKWVIRRLEDGRLKIVKEGVKYLSIVRDPIFQALALRKALPPDESRKLTKDLQLSPI
jgi:hypothetical protein